MFLNVVFILLSEPQSLTIKAIKTMRRRRIVVVTDLIIRKKLKVMSTEP